MGCVQLYGPTYVMGKPGADGGCESCLVLWSVYPSHAQADSRNCIPGPSTAFKGCCSMKAQPHPGVVE